MFWWTADKQKLITSDGKKGGRGQCAKCGEWYNNVSYHSSVCGIKEPNTIKVNPLYIVERQEDEQPHCVPYDPEGGCMAEGSGGYWRQFIKTNNGETVSGYGTTAEQAISDASLRRKNRETEINGDPKEIIRKLISKPNGCRGTHEQEDFNRAVAKLLGIE